VQGDTSTPESASPPGLPAGVTVISIHPMYSPRQVALATFLGGPLGGGWLMAVNYKRLGEPAKMRRAIVLSVLAMAAVIAIGFVLGNGAAWVLALLPVFAMREVASALQGAAYLRHVEAGGSRGSSWRAAGLGGVSLVIYLGVIFGIVALQFVVNGPRDAVMVGGTGVFYTDGIPRTEAEAVGEELLAIQHLGRDAKRSVQVTRDGDRRVVGFVMKDVAFSDDEVQMEYHQFAEPLSRKVYGGAPVDVWFLDGNMQPHAKLSWETRPHSLDLGDDHRVVYLAGIEETQARGVAKAFQDRGMFRPGHKMSVAVKTVGSRYVVALTATRKLVQDAEFRTWIHRLARACSEQAFGGRPVDIWLYVEPGSPPVNLYWESRPD
jgi:hypothetical protein